MCILGGVERSYRFVITGTVFLFGSVRVGGGGGGGDGWVVGAALLVVVVDGRWVEDVSLRVADEAQSFEEAASEAGMSCSWSFWRASTKPRAKLS